jgi:hypothetical protein
MEATETIDSMWPLAIPSLADEAEAEFQHLCALLNQRSIKELAQMVTEPECLQQEVDFLWECAPKLMQHQLSLITNPSNIRALRERNTHSLENALERAAHTEIALRAHAYSNRACCVLMLARSMSLSHLHTSTTVLRMIQSEHLVLSAFFLRKICHQLKDYIPRTPYVPSVTLIWLNTDNLDIYSRKVHTRLKDGERIKSTLLHALVTERIFYDPIHLLGAAPECSLWERTPTEEFRLSVVPKVQETHEWLTNLWCKYRVKVEADPMSPMHVPDPELDQQRSGKTITQSLPILTNHSTSTSADLASYMRQAEEWFPNAYFLHLGDFPTFRNIWFNVWRSKPAFNKHVPLGDEFHLQTHHNHAAKILWYPHVIRPAALMLYRSDVRISYEAARYNTQESFVRMLTCAVLRYLSELGLPEQLMNNPLMLMAHVEHNVGLWELVGFAFYYGIFALENKNAMRVADNTELDRAWMYTTLLGRPAGKKNYAKYGVMMQITMWGTHPWVRAVIRGERTFRETDKPCTGRGKGVVVERV